MSRILFKVCKQKRFFYNNKFGMLCELGSVINELGDRAIYKYEGMFYGTHG